MRTIKVKVLNTDCFDSDPKEKYHVLNVNAKQRVIEFGADVVITEPEYWALKHAVPTIWRLDGNVDEKPKLISEEKPRFQVIELSEWMGEPDPPPASAEPQKHEPSKQPRRGRPHREDVGKSLTPDVNSGAIVTDALVAATTAMVVDGV